MKTFKVKITEVYTREIEVRAENGYDAYDKVDTMINDGEIDLPCDGGNYGYKRELEVNETKKESNVSKSITVTKEQLKERLENGEHLEDIVQFTDGQECLIYKGDFEVSDNIIYIPDIWLNELNVDSKATEEDIEDIIHNCYTGKDFMEECHDIESVAETLFNIVDWQHPDIQDVLDGYTEDDDEEFKKEYGVSIKEFLN